MPNLIPPFKLNHDYIEKFLEGKEYYIYSPQKISGRKYEHIQISRDSCVFRLKDKTQLDIVSQIIVEKKIFSKKELLEIKWTKSSTPKKKLLSYLFDLLLIEFEYEIISDKTHTSPGSKEYWLSLGKKKSCDLYIYIMLKLIPKENTKTKQKKKFGT